MRSYFTGGLAAMIVALASSAIADDIPNVAPNVAPNVVVSIPPIHSLVAGVMEGVGEPALIVKGSASPHTYALRPSEAKALQEAELVVWVGESMETFLSGSISTLAPDARVLELMEAPGVAVLSFRDDEAWEQHDHGDHDDHETHGHDEEMAHDAHDAHDHDEHDHHDADGHIWLNPSNAKAIVAAVVTDLIAIDPDHAAMYRANGARIAAEIDALTVDVTERLAPVADQPYIVFHDAVQYFGEAFDTIAIGAVTLSPDRQLGAARIAEIRKRLIEEGVVCVFREPQFSPRLIDTVIEGTDVRVGVLDPLGAELAPGPDLYGLLMMDLADGLVDCLAGG